MIERAEIGRLAAVVAGAEGCRTSVERFAVLLQASAPAWAELGDDRLQDLYLALACADGDDGAAAWFSRRHDADIRRVGRRILGDEMLDDFVQDVLGHLLVAGGSGPPPRIGRYEGRGSLRGFVRMVASRLAIDGRRAADESRPDDLDLQMSGTMHLDDGLERVESQGLLAKALSAATAELAPHERRALRMRYLLGFSVTRTALALGMHPASVSRMFGRVRARIVAEVRAQLADGADGQPAAAILAALTRSLDVSVARWLRSQVGDVDHPDEGGV